MSRISAPNKSGVTLPFRGVVKPGETEAFAGRALPSAAEFPNAGEMDVTDLRVAIFSGNYNYVRDGANQALNRLADYLLRQGAQVRVYSPTTKTPAFEPKGDLVGLDPRRPDPRPLGV